MKITKSMKGIVLMSCPLHRECHQNVKDTATLFTKMGFHIHPEKSIFVPTQQLTFLGFVVDSIAMTVKLTGEIINTIISVCDTLLHTPMPTFRQLF